MNSRERVKRAFDHKSGRVPVDFGSTAVTGIHVSCVGALREYYGLERHPVKVTEPYQMLGELEDDLLDAIGVDTIGLPAPSTLFGFRNENWKEFQTPWGQTVLVSEHFNFTTDSKGDLLLYPQGDTAAPPSGRMPASSFAVAVSLTSPAL